MLAVLTLAAIPWTIGILQHGLEGFLVGILAIGALGAFAFVFLGLQAILGHVAFRVVLPREVAVRDGKLHVTRAGKTQEYDLVGCRWYEGSTLVDNVEMFSRLRRGIVLQSPQGNLALGHDPDGLEHWKAFLTLHRMPVRQPLGCLRLIGLTSTGAIVGSTIGIVLGYLASTATNQPAWQAMLGFLGAIDGFASTLIYAAATSEHAAAARRRFHPLLLSLPFGLIGAKVGLFVGLTGIIVGMVINALIGLGLGWLCWQKIRLEELDLETERQARLVG